MGKVTVEQGHQQYPSLITFVGDFESFCLNLFSIHQYTQWPRKLAYSWRGLFTGL